MVCVHSIVVQSASSRNLMLLPDHTEVSSISLLYINVVSYKLKTENQIPLSTC